MKDYVLISRLTVYDLLAMVIPGALISSILCHIYAICLSNGDYRLVDSIFTGFMEGFGFWTGFIVVSYLLGIIFNLLSEGMFSSWLRCSCRIEAMRLKCDKNLNVDYFDAWYYVNNSSKSTVVPILEGQVAFMRNLIIPLSLLVCHLTICICCYNGVMDTCMYAFPCACCLILVVLLLVAINERQNKIVYRVFEDYKYLTRISSHPSPLKSCEDCPNLNKAEEPIQEMKISESRARGCPLIDSDASRVLKFLLVLILFAAFETLFIKC